MPAPIKTVQNFKVAGSDPAFPESDPHILALANGQFDIAWTQDRTKNNPIDTDVRIARFNADGTSALTGSKSGSVSVRGPVDDGESEASLATLGTTQVVAYSDRANPHADGVIRLSFYDAGALNQAGLTGKTVVVDATAGHKVNPEVVVLKDGKLAVAYVDADTNALKARVYDPSKGAFTSEPFTLSKCAVSYVNADLDLALLPLSDGRFVTSWRGENGVGELRIADAAGKVSFSLTGGCDLGFPTDVLETGAGKLGLVTLGENGGIRFTTIDLASKAVSDPVQVSSHGFDPDAVSLGGGRTMIVWQDGGNIVGQVVNADGKADGTLFTVADTADALGRPHLAKLADGRVAVSWENTTAGDIYAAVYDPREAGVSLTGTAGDDQFFGTRFADKFSMGSGNDAVWAGAGNDLINGGAGLDTMRGGAGDDTYVVENAGDKTIEAAGEGRDSVQSSVSWTLAQNLEVLQLTGAAHINGTGNGLASTVIGNGGNNVISAAGTMIGGSGNDTYARLSGTETIVEKAGGGIDTITLLTPSYVLAAGVEIERIVAADPSARVPTSIKGNEFAQTIEGTAGNDKLDGAGGADTLIGFAGNDTYVVDNAGDLTIEQAGGGTDTVLSSIGWRLGANLENLTLTGTANGNANGNGNNNTLTGNSGNNMLLNAGSKGTMIGGLGDDTYLVKGGETIVEAKGAGNDRVEVDGFTYALAAGVEIETLSSAYTLWSNGVTLSGNEFGQNIVGSMGNDVLDGKGGADRLTGRSGDDIYYVDNAGDQVVEAASDGTDTVVSSISWTLGANLEKLRLTGTANIDANGNNNDNTLVGNSGNNFLGYAGSKGTMIGGLGNDSYLVTGGETIIEAKGGGYDRVRVEGSSYALAAGVEIESLESTQPAWVSKGLTLSGNEFAQWIKGSMGNDFLNGKGGADTLVGYSGNDTYSGITGAETIVENANSGFDTIKLTTNSYTLAEGVAIEQILAEGPLNATIIGNEFAQTISGTAGNDVLDGRGGADTLYGGAGNDLYVVDNADDKVFETDESGSDTVQAGVSWTLGLNLENLILSGTANIDATGNGNDNTLTGNSGNNTLANAGAKGTMIGGLGNDTYVVKGGETIVEAKGQGLDTVVVDREVGNYTLAAGVEIEALRSNFTTSTAISGLTGNEFGQTITGTYGSNLLDGKGGSDVLIGLSGSDTFVFSSALGAGNVDHIAQFDKTATDQDTIYLDDAIFTALAPAGYPLKSDFFTASTEGVAKDANDFIVYDTDTGNLFYDADGSGGGAAILFAVLDDKAALTASDFIVI